jgi:hypothetical protein
LQNEVELEIHEIKELLMKIPRYLDFKVTDKVLGFVKWFREVGLSREDVFQMLLRHSTVLSNNLEGKIKPLISYLEQEHVFGDRSLREILLNSWNSLNYKNERIKERHERMKAVGMQMTVSHIAMKPEAFEALIASKRKE